MSKNLQATVEGSLLGGVVFFLQWLSRGDTPAGDTPSVSFLCGLELFGRLNFAMCVNPQ